MAAGRERKTYLKMRTNWPKVLISALPFDDWLCWLPDGKVCSRGHGGACPLEEVEERKQVKNHYHGDNEKVLRDRTNAKMLIR